jgi:hypothetical protein
MSRVLNDKNFDDPYRLDDNQNDNADQYDNFRHEYHIDNDVHWNDYDQVVRVVNDSYWLHHNENEYYNGDHDYAYEYFRDDNKDTHKHNKQYYDKRDQYYAVKHDYHRHYDFVDCIKNHDINDELNDDGYYNEDNNDGICRLPPLSWANFAI